MALFIILAGFYRSLEQEASPVNMITRRQKAHHFEREQCFSCERAWLQRASGQRNLLLSLKNNWDGPCYVQSVKARDDLWELMVCCGLDATEDQIPSWLRKQTVTLSLRSCTPQKGCLYKCCIFI